MQTPRVLVNVPSPMTAYRNGFHVLVAVACAAGCISPPALGQAARAPKAQLWIDASTGQLPGVPEAAGPVGLFGAGSLFGGRAASGKSEAGPYGNARGFTLTPARVLDVALITPSHPAAESTLLVPAGLQAGEGLPLLPPTPASSTTHSPSGPGERKGRILIYWGCSAEIGNGQPRVIDLARAAPGDMPALFGGHYGDDTPRVTPKHVLYPNRKADVQFPRGSSLAGEYKAQGPGVPPSMQFTLGAEQDFLSPPELQAKGSPAEAIKLNWGSVAHARAYFIAATGSKGSDIIMWSSARAPETGGDLFGYLTNATMENLARKGILLKASETTCTIPRGIFEGAPSTAARMVAHGGETHIVNADWTVRLRTKSHTMALLGEQGSGSGFTGGAGSSGSGQAGSGVPDVPNPLNLFRGMLGR